MSDEITHKYDPDYNRLEFFVDGELFCSWWCASVDELEENIAMFHKIYELGKSEQAKRIEELSDAIHYPGCWDTVTYPTLLDAIKEIGCNPLDCVQGSIQD